MIDRSAEDPVAAIHVAGAVLMPDPSGALWWPSESILVVADLHLEKGSALAGRGALVPPYDTAATLERLARVIEARRPRTVISLGDSFHDVGAGDRFPEPYRDRLAALQHGRDWLWIAGNHDPTPPAGIAGDWFEELAVGGLVFRHEPDAVAPDGEIAGHLHPSARVRLRGRSVRRRCFAGDGRRLVMPAFGAFTGGLNILDEAYSGLFERQALAAWMIGDKAVYPIAGRRLLPD
ncbi:ligase-associated DNA damage response endonuclease PdeM [Microbaculum marinisediminis]|uniref:Ligase-associated DNA damage response endonuclease PdeM n=1 Tax=Microbaculum marinisediminis TaxID=2931392 RepID=A0AAW5QWI5_9HYPH|nr:ligase-associated DNA damage response endonuclease PdeM [Microbaculum sp. A6E488]MCT8970684.1 ligase-associated DNA damage response endonuclease PdeM [Microbaculum sp. A6E488]